MQIFLLGGIRSRFGNYYFKDGTLMVDDCLGKARYTQTLESLCSYATTVLHIHKRVRL